jgi:hypothetical protein
MFAKLISYLCAVLLAISFIAGFSPSAAAQSGYCGERAEIVDYLKSQYKEAQRGFGMVDQSLIIELFVGPGGSWTLLTTNTGGKSCLIGGGTDWQEIDVPTVGVKGSS